MLIVQLPAPSVYLGARWVCTTVYYSGVYLSSVDTASQASSDEDDDRNVVASYKQGSRTQNGWWAGNHCV